MCQYGSASWKNGGPGSWPRGVTSHIFPAAFSPSSQPIFRACLMLWRKCSLVSDMSAFSKKITPSSSSWSVKLPDCPIYGSLWVSCVCYTQVAKSAVSRSSTCRERGVHSGEGALASVALLTPHTTGSTLIP